MALTNYEFLQLAGALSWDYEKAQEVWHRHASEAFTESISAAGALTPYGLTELTVSGTKAYTMRAPEHAGQRKRVKCISASGTPAGTFTIALPDDTSGFTCPATFFFDTAGQELEFVATAALKWRCVKKIRAGAKTLVVGTTDAAGIADMSHINLSVTGTVQSTGTKGIPVGAAVGELLIVGCSTAGGTPHGDIFVTAVRDTKGTAGNTLDDFTATTDQVLMMWVGAEWQILNNHSTAVAVTTV